MHLAFDLDTRNSTVLRVKAQEPPWRVVRGFDTPAGERLAHLHNVSGGILDTDSLEWLVEVGPHARAQVTSTGATRVHRSRSQDRIARQRAVVKIGEGGYFEYLPDQLIPFAGSRFEQTARIEMGAGASAIWWDVVAPGREASSEVFRYESLASSFELTASGEPVATENWKILPLNQPLDSVARLGRFRHFATCYVCRAGEPARYWRALEADLQALADRTTSPDVLWGVTTLRAHGLVIRGVAVSGRVLTESLVELWRAAKWSLCGRVAALPRKVH